MFKFSMALSAAKESFRFTMDLYTNFSVKPEAGRDFRLGSLSANMVRFSGNGTKGDFRYIALYVEFLAGELGGYSKGIFEFRTKPYTANVSFVDLMFGAG